MRGFRFAFFFHATRIWSQNQKFGERLLENPYLAPASRRLNGRHSSLPPVQRKASLSAVGPWKPHPLKVPLKKILVVARSPRLVRYESHIRRNDPQPSRQARTPVQCFSASW